MGCARTFPTNSSSSSPGAIALRLRGPERRVLREIPELGLALVARPRAGEAGAGRG